MAHGHCSWVFSVMEYKSASRYRKLRSYLFGQHRDKGLTFRLASYEKSLLNTLGGYLIVRYDENENPILDYLAGVPVTSA